MKCLESDETESDSSSNNCQELDGQISNGEKNNSLFVSYISDENINKCWLIFSDIILCLNTQNDIVINYKMDKGKNTYTIGNIFSCYWIGISKMHYKCIESHNDYGIKKISWIICSDIGISLRKTYTLYPITSNNKTLIILKLELICTENYQPINLDETKDYYYSLQHSIINKTINLMNESPKFFYMQESFIAKKNIEICWKEMTNFNILSRITNENIGQNFVCKGDPNTIGTFWKCYLKKINQNIYFKVKNVKKNKKRNKWVYCLETFGVEFTHTKQKIEIAITKIKSNSCQISILIKFKENLDKTIYADKKNRFRENMKKIKSYINSSNDKEKCNINKNNLNN